ncbi:MAG TPA: glycosyltransferase family A protein [Flavisolibacter sp.]|nr:glycosyltransferase family A protein [Flavisolibacter sp.]
MISIITPTYNRRDLLQATIKSILAQTYTDWELIVMDDGSTDDTEQVMQRFLNDSRIRYYKKENTGQPHTLNVGFTHARGEFITFLDSDDEAYPEWLATAHRNIKADTGIVCLGAIRKFTDGTEIKEGIYDYKFYNDIYKVKFTCGSLFIRSSVFKAIGGYDIELKANIQTDLGYRILEHLKHERLKVVSLDEYLVQINIHNGPRIRTNWEKTRTGGIQYYQKHFNYLKKHDPQVLSGICSSIAFSSYKSKKRAEAVRYLAKAIWYNPSRLTNYVRLVKYSML